MIRYCNSQNGTAIHNASQSARETTWKLCVAGVPTGNFCGVDLQAFAQLSSGDATDFGAIEHPKVELLHLLNYHV